MKRGSKCRRKKRPPKRLKVEFLVSAAKAIGTVVRKAAAKFAMVKPDPRERAVSQKLSKKNKHKLPRREKKAAKKDSK
jgi:hypothetical protein